MHAAEHVLASLLVAVNASPQTSDIETSLSGIGCELEEIKEILRAYIPDRDDEDPQLPGWVNEH